MARSPADHNRAAAAEGRAPAALSSQRRGAPHRLTVAVAVLGLAVTALLTIASRINYQHNEQRLTTLQTQLTASALSVAPEDLERRLGVAVGVASQARDPASAYERVMAPSMQPAGPFVTSTLVQVVGGVPHVVMHLGAKSLHQLSSPATLSLFDLAAKSRSLVTTRAVAHGAQRLGYLMSATGPAGTFVVSAGESLPSSRRLVINASSPYANLYGAIYYGPTTSPADLVGTNAPSLPLTGTVSKSEVPFGNTVLTLVVSARGSLAGSWSEFLPWGILVVGVLFTAAIAVMTERLTRRRELAEALAAENRALFQEQRSVAETLQHSLLPRELPQREGLSVGVRYLPGTSGIDVGGDWYDVVEVDAQNVLFTVGDVAGRGLEAAALMSMLRNAIKAFASQGDEPDVVLARLARMVDVGRDGRFATVLCGRIDTSTGEVALANAGHLRPLLIENGSGEFVSTELGPPIG
ncbi:MAG TPA: SpoIIE family protein phosphatase, partial [Acidimicrobiales bacterium]|nr:SpoIIE family protein phosphatase [Acidimicrobiales bacterium]